MTVTRAVPALARASIRLEGLMSRWTNPDSWAACSPKAACRINSHASETGNWRWRDTRLLSDSPSRYSMTR